MNGSNLILRQQITPILSAIRCPGNFLENRGIITSLQIKELRSVSDCQNLKAGLPLTNNLKIFSGNRTSETQRIRRSFLKAKEFSPRSAMKGEVFTVSEASASADEIWAVFSSPEIGKILLQVLPTLFENIVVESGDGGAGTVLQIFLNQALPEPRTWKEQFVTIDHKERKKVIRMTEGGFLDLGFTLYEIIFQVIEKDSNSCSIKATVAFEADDDKFTAMASRISPASIWAFSKAIAGYALKEKVTA